MYLVIEPLSSELRDAGLSASQLRTDVELRLRSADVPVLTMEKGSKEPGNPYLNLRVAYLKSEAGFSVFTTRLALYQHVSPSRNPSQLLVAATWSAGEMSYIIGNGVSSIGETVRHSVDRFCNDYLAVHQKDPSGKFIPFDFKYSGPHEACERWGKPEDYVSQLITDYNKMKAHFSKAEVLHAAKQACKQRVTSETDLVDCRDCVEEIATALFKGKDGR